MKLAISNLAWNSRDDIPVARLLQSIGVSGVELAPTKVWASPLNVSDMEVADYRQLWASFGIEIVAIQSLLFGHPELRMFETAEVRAQTLDYLMGVARLAGRLGATALVFGSPGNRLKGALSASAAASIAVPFFRALAAEASANGVVCCIEANPARYRADWILTTREAFALVEAVGHEGFGLNVDTGGMTLSGEDPTEALVHCAKAIRHFHISEPDLAPIGTGNVDHAQFAEALARTNYSGWRSIEMREPLPGSDVTLQTALAAARKYYGGD